jgi:hypothetical protein
VTLRAPDVINEKSFSWSAGTTSLSKLPKEQWKNYLGLVVPEDERKRIQEMMLQEDARAAAKGRVFVYPSSWDWRMVSGNNWTTPIRDQSGCGACVAFATVAMIESNLEIFRRNPNLNPDLSEADLFFRGCGACCQRGWNFSPALNYARTSGIPDEACYPYRSNQNQSCPNRATRIIKIESWKTIPNAAQAKEWLARKGPIMSGLHVYDDFYYYLGGIYKNATGAYVGDHAVCIVGYDDARGCWICKNSWSTGWGENGWFKIGYGECGIGNGFAFYAVQFSTDNDLILPKEGRVLARFMGKNTALQDEIWLSYPESRLIFRAEEASPGGSFYVGAFPSGSRLTFALKTSDGHTYFTDQSLNEDACGHVKKVQAGIYKWELRWEDLYGLGEQDFNDVVMEIEIFNPSSDDLIIPKDGRVLVTLKSKLAEFQGDFGLVSPRSQLIFKADEPLGKAVDLGIFQAGTKLSFAMKMPDGHTYFTDQMQNPDFLVHSRKLPVAYNKWQFRWEESFGLKNKDYKDLIVEVEVIPVSNEDVVLSKNSRVVARLAAKNTPSNNQLWLYRPEEKKLFDSIKENVGKSFEVGSFPAGTRLVFALKTQDGNTYYTDSNLNQDARAHVLKAAVGSSKCQLRWEDRYGLKDRDYNDLIVEIAMYQK